MARSARRGPARDRMVASAAGLLGSRGVHGTSFADVLSKAKAPRGSIYYYFPAGKQELVEDAVAWTTAAVLGYQRTCRSKQPGGVVHHFAEFFRQSLTDSQCTSGCPLGAVVIGTLAPSAPLQRSVRGGFRSWTELLTEQLRATGLAPSAARGLATLTLASVEGALLLARAEGSTEPLDRVERQLRGLAKAPR